MTLDGPAPSPAATLEGVDLAAFRAALPSGRHFDALAVVTTILVNSGTDVEAELTADNPGLTLFHCHQQDHMDMGIMMLFRYA